MAGPYSCAEKVLAQNRRQGYYISVMSLWRCNVCIRCCLAVNLSRFHKPGPARRAAAGAAWPTIYPQFGVPVSYAGVISMIIAAGTVVSSLLGDRLNRALGTGKVTAISVGVTACALFGFSISSSFWQLCAWAVPYGLGAGSVDAALNNFVALHYKSRHMSWLHCFWGIGASVGPYIMGFALSNGEGWGRWVQVYSLSANCPDRVSSSACRCGSGRPRRTAMPKRAALSA